MPGLVIDLSGSEELCTEPGALERVRKAYARLEPGGRLEVRSPIAEHAFAVRAWSRKNGVNVIVDEPSEGYRRLILEAPRRPGDTEGVCRGLSPRVRHRGASG